jgi:hypothetical protein
MAAHNSNAMAIARFLEKHPKVSFVLYPGLGTFLILYIFPLNDLFDRILLFIF